MPIYEFQCTACEAKFEELRRHNDKTQAKCPKCGSKEVKRLFSVFGFTSGSKEVCTSTSGCSSCQGGNCSTCRH